MGVVENYLDLKSSKNFIQLSDELAGTENRIAVAKKDYNNVVKTLNTTIKKLQIIYWQECFDLNKLYILEQTDQVRRFLMLTLNKKNIVTKILIMCFIMINTFPVSSLAVVNPTADFYVNDYTGLLDRENENYIINANKSLYDQTGAQIVVVTISSLGNNSLEDYVTELFRNFGIGDKEKTMIFCYW